MSPKEIYDDGKDYPPIDRRMSNRYGTCEHMVAIIEAHVHPYDYFLLEDYVRHEVLILLLAEPRNWQSLEEELNQQRPAGVRTRTLRVHPDIDKEALDSVWRLSGSEGVMSFLDIKGR